VVLQSDGSVNVFASVDGLSPFYVDMTPAAVAGPFSTAVDVDRSDQLHYPSGIHGGLSTGVFETTSLFVIESRDRFSNRVLLGPRNEVLLIGVTGSTGGTFTLLVNGVSTTALNYNAAASTIAAAVQATGQVGSPVNHRDLRRWGGGVFLTATNHAPVRYPSFCRCRLFALPVNHPHRWALFSPPLPVLV
jgi:hypothetical protein